MKYCRQCGNLLNENDRVCPICNTLAIIDVKQESDKGEEEIRQKTTANQMAVYSIICGIIGFFIMGWAMGFASIGGGIQSIRMIKEGEKGKGLAIVAIIIGIIDIVGVEIVKNIK